MGFSWLRAWTRKSTTVRRHTTATGRLRPRLSVKPLEDRQLLATHFLLTGVPSPITAGATATVTVEALDASNNIDTMYWSPFHFTSSDSWASLPETSFLTNGVGTFTIKLQTAGTQSLTATDNGNSTITGSLSVVVSPAATSQFLISGPVSPLSAGIANQITVKAADTYGNLTPGYTGTVHLSSSDPQAVLPAGHALTNGTGTFQVTFNTAGTQTLTATDSVDPNILGYLSEIQQVVPVYSQTPNLAGGYDKSAWYSPNGLDGDQYVWDSFVLPANQSINSLRWRGAYTNYLSGAGESPVYDFTIAIYGSIAAGTQPDVTLQPLAQYDVGGNAGETPAGTFGGVNMYDYQYTLPTGFHAVAGTKYWVQIEAWQGLTPTYYWPPDWSLAYASNGDGSHFREIIGGSLAGGNAYQSVSGDVAFTLQTAVNASGVVVNAGSTTPSKFAVSALPSSVIAGKAQSFTITALNADGTTATGYQGTIHFTSSDTKAVLPADYTFTAADSGTHSFSATFVTAGVRTLVATDTATSALTGTAKITVQAAAVNHLAITAPTSTTAGAAFSLTATAQDAFNNTVTSYIGTVHFTSTDPQVTLPADYTFVAADKGKHVFTKGVVLKTAGTRSITVTDTSVGSVLGSRSIKVNPAITAALQLIGFPTAATAGTAYSFTVTAFDAYGNVATGYRGTVAFTSSDGKAVLPASYTFTATDKGKHSFKATLYTLGVQWLTVTDALGLTGTEGGITVA